MTDISDIHPDLRLACRLVPPLPLHHRFVRGIANKILALAPDTGSVSGVSITTHQIGNTRIRLYHPNTTLTGAGLLWIHGGGYILGTAAMDDKICARFAKEHRMVVVSADYRLAPRFPFPTPLDDCHTAWQWLLKNARQLAVDPHKIVISGQSAGGGLAAALVQKIHDAGGIQPLAQMLFCPMLDDRTAQRTDLDKANHKLWNNRNNRGGWQAYLGTPANETAPPSYAVPARRKNLIGLPEAWIGVGDIDLFFSETQEYVQRLQKADVACHFEVVAGGPHGFERIAPNAPVTQRYMESSARFLHRVYGAAANASAPSTA